MSRSRRTGDLVSGSNLFVDTSKGVVAVGTASTAGQNAKLQIKNNDGVSLELIGISSNLMTDGGAGSYGGGYLVLSRAGVNTSGITTRPTTGQVLGSIDFNGFKDPDFWTAGASIRAVAGANWNNTPLLSQSDFNQTDLVFYTNSRSPGLDESMRIKSSGWVGIGTTNPQADLNVHGNSSAEILVSTNSIIPASLFDSNRYLSVGVGTITIFGSYSSGHMTCWSSAYAGVSYDMTADSLIYSSQGNVFQAYGGSSSDRTYIYGRNSENWEAVYFSETNNIPKHTKHTNGTTSAYASGYFGRAFESGTTSTPTSYYRTGEHGCFTYADSAVNLTYISARDTADTSIVFYSEVNDEPNIEFTAAGNGYWDGTGDLGAADYAEYFEWEDGNPNNEDRVGKTVVLVGEKIRLSTENDNPALIIGVVSGRPAIVGDSAHFGWHGRYKSDEFNRRILEDVEIYVYEGIDGKQERVRKDSISPDQEIPENWTLTTTQALSISEDYDPNQEYIPRSERPEWSAIGLVGKLTVYKGQLVGDRWIKMKNINDNLEQWLVR